MKIEAHIIAFNESETIHLTIRHYQQFCNRIVIYDNFSTDNTRDICESMGCEVRTFGIAGVLDDKEYLKVKNHCWKGSDADWVIVCDADEILQYRPCVLLSAMAMGQTIFKTCGWSIFSNEIPKENWLEITNGVPDEKYSKQIIFNPKQIKEIGYIYGCHELKPKGNVKYAGEALMLFHYKHVGGSSRVVNRHNLYSKRRSDFNKRWKLGDNYDDPIYKTIKYFDDNLAKATVYV